MPGSAWVVLHHGSHAPLPVWLAIIVVAVIVFSVVMPLSAIVVGIAGVVGKKK